MRPPLSFVASVGLAVLIGTRAAAADLHDAARRADLAAVERLLAGGAQVDAQDGNHATALYLAAREGHVAVVARLLAAGGNPRYQVTNHYGASIGTPMHAAAISGHLEVVRQLLDAGVDPNLPDLAAGPPLHVAVRSGQSAVEKLLRSRGARSIASEPVDHLIASADTAAGQEIAGACAACHDLAKGAKSSERFGPPLWDVVGRSKAGVSGFAYSNGMRKFGGLWTYAELSSYIANPKQFVPGTSMEFRGIAEPKRRAALIAHLRTLSDRPQPAP